MSHQVLHNNPWAPPLNGVFTVLDLPSNKQAIAKACRFDQKRRVFHFDPES